MKIMRLAACAILLSVCGCRQQPLLRVISCQRSMENLNVELSMEHDKRKPMFLLGKDRFAINVAADVAEVDLGDDTPFRKVNPDGARLVHNDFPPPDVVKSETGQKDIKISIPLKKFGFDSSRISKLKIQAIVTPKIWTSTVPDYQDYYITLRQYGSLITAFGICN